MGSANDHPSPVELQNRLKWYILGKHSAQALSIKKNTEDELTSVSFMDIEDVHATACMVSLAVNGIRVRNKTKFIFFQLI